MTESLFEKVAWFKVATTLFFIRTIKIGLLILTISLFLGYIVLNLFFFFPNSRVENNGLTSGMPDKFSTMSDRKMISFA